MKKKVCLFIMILILVVTFVGCNNQETTSDEVTKDTLIVAMPADISTLDCQQTVGGDTRNVFINIYNSLVREKDSEIYPELSTDWEVSDNGLIWTFNIKEGVKFHNGEELKARDVVFTFERAESSPYLTSIMMYIDSVKEIDEYTVEITLNQLYAPFLQYLSECFILNEKAVTELGDDYGLNPVGTGAYKYVDRKVGQSVTLERFDDYFKGVVPIKTVTFKVIPDPNTALIAIESGDVDICNYVPAISVNDIEGDDELNTRYYNSASTSYVVMNLLKEPTSDVNFRKAINYAIDKETAIQLNLEGLGKPATGIIGEMVFGYSDEVKGYEHNPEKAKEFLEQSSYDGRTIKLGVWEKYKKGAEVIQNNLKEIGIDADIEIQEFNASAQNLATGNYDLFLIDVGIGKDASGWSMAFHSAGIQGGFNFSKFSNEKVDGLFEKGSATYDQQERLKVYKQIAQILEDEAIVAPVYYKLSIHVMNKDLNIDDTPFSVYRLEDVSWN